MAEKKDALSKVEGTATLAIMDTDASAVMDALRAELGDEAASLGTALFTRVKMPAGGGRAYEIEGDDPDNPELAQTIEGVVVAHHASNAYWARSMEEMGGGSEPDCYSRDGFTGHGSRFDGDCDAPHVCSECQLNQFGSDAKGGKACKNMRHIYILRADEQLPLLLTIPAASLKSWSVFVAKSVLLKGRTLQGVMTRVGIERAKSREGIDYSRATFAVAGELSPEASAAAAAYGASLKGLLASAAPVTGHAPVASSAASGDDLPF